MVALELSHQKWDDALANEVHTVLLIEYCKLPEELHDRLLCGAQAFAIVQVFEKNAPVMAGHQVLLIRRVAMREELRNARTAILNTRILQK
jgi:hypothetical protein